LGDDPPKVFCRLITALLSYGALGLTMLFVLETFKEALVGYF